MRYRQLLIGIGLIAGLLIVISPPLAKARENTEPTMSEQSTNPEMYEHSVSTNAEHNTSDREEAKRLEQTNKTTEKATAKKTEMRVKCEARLTKIETLMSRVVANRKEHVAKLSSIVEKVEDFYLKSGVVSPNHGALLADVNEKRVAAEAAANNITGDVLFSCESDKPRMDSQLFKDERSSAVSAVHAYRQSIRALIEDIKQTHVSAQKDKGVQQ